MNIMVSMKTAALAAALSLAGCASIQDSNHTPDVVSYDHGALDTLVALGQEDAVLAVPKAQLPDYLQEVAANLPDAGSLKVPDQEALKTLQPDLILTTGRQGDAREALEEIAEVLDVSLARGPFRQALEDKVLTLAARYGEAHEARHLLDHLWQHVAQQRQSLPEDFQVLVVSHNEGRFSLRREAVVSELLGLKQPPLPDSVEAVQRGSRTFYPLKVDDLVKMAPDLLLVVDRSAAIGKTPMDVQAFEQALRKAGGSDLPFSLLDPKLWYLSGAGLQSVQLQVDEVTHAVNAVQRTHR